MIDDRQTKSASQSPPALSPAGPFSAADRQPPPAPPLRVERNDAETVQQLRAQIALLARRIVDLERRQERRPLTGTQGTDPLFRVFFAKQADGSDVQFQEQVLDDGVFVDGDADKSRRCTDDADPSAIITPDAGVVPLLMMEDTTGDGVKVRRFALISSGSSLRVVSLSSPTGSAGTDIAQCAFVYDVADYFTGDAIDTAIAMDGKGQRPQTGQMAPGTIGFMVKKSGTHKLVWADEQVITTACAGALDGGSA